MSVVIETSIDTLKSDCQGGFELFGDYPKDFLVPAGFQAETEFFCQEYDAQFTDDESHVVDCSASDRKRYLSEKVINNHPIILSRTVFDSGTITRCIIFPVRKVVFGITETREGTFYGETHLIHHSNKQMPPVEHSTRPLRHADHQAKNYFSLAFRKLRLGVEQEL